MLSEYLLSFVWWGKKKSVSLLHCLLSNLLCSPFWGTREHLSHLYSLHCCTDPWGPYFWWLVMLLIEEFKLIQPTKTHRKLLWIKQSAKTYDMSSVWLCTISLLLYLFACLVCLYNVQCASQCLVCSILPLCLHTMVYFLKRAQAASGEICRGLQDKGFPRRIGSTSCTCNHLAVARQSRICSEPWGHSISPSWCPWACDLQ